MKKTTTIIRQVKITSAFPVIVTAKNKTELLAKIQTKFGAHWEYSYGTSGLMTAEHLIAFTCEKFRRKMRNIGTKASVLMPVGMAGISYGFARFRTTERKQIRESKWVAHVYMISRKIAKQFKQGNRTFSAMIAI